MPLNSFVTLMRRFGRRNNSRGMDGSSLPHSPTDLATVHPCSTKDTMLAKLVAMGVIPFCLMASANADAPVLIRPECKGMFYGPDFVDVDASGRAVPEKRPKPNYLPWNSSRAKPMAFRDPHTGISFYVESDGRHLAAISPEGRLLWVRNPFDDRHLCQYRTPRPVIDRMEAADSGQHSISIKYWNGDLKHDVIFLQFDSSQYGVLDQSTGDFYPEGQN